MKFTNANEVRELLRRFESCELPLQEFSHAAHVAVATTLLLEHGHAAALERMRAGLLRLTAHYGKQNKYSEEITRQWMERLAAYVESVQEPNVVGVVNGAVAKFVGNC